MNKRANDRVHGLDSLRAVLAFAVVLSHNGLFPLSPNPGSSAGIGAIAKALYGTSVNGAAAVIAFFVISGFCIHFPYRNGAILVHGSITHDGIRAFL